MLKLIITNNNNAKKTIAAITKIKKAEEYPDEVSELVNEVFREGVAYSYDHSRIYFLAYLLSKEYIDVNVVRVKE